MFQNKAFATILLALAFAPASPAATLAGPFGEGRWVGLTHDFSARTVYWPTAEPFRLETVFEGETEGGYFYSARKFSAAEHGGTHLDAPVHFAAGRQSVAEIPLSRLMGPAVVVDVSHKAAADRDYRVGIEDFMAWEAVHGAIPDGAIVLLRTGFGRFWPDRAAYMGTDARGSQAVADLHFPGLHPDAASWVAENRALGAIGLDTPSIDFGQSKQFLSHRILFEKNIPAFENVAGLESLPATGAYVIALPMKITGGTGAPLRIVAFVPEKGAARKP